MAGCAGVLGCWGVAGGVGFCGVGVVRVGGWAGVVGCCGAVVLPGDAAVAGPGRLIVQPGRIRFGSVKCAPPGSARSWLAGHTVDQSVTPSCSARPDSVSPACTVTSCSPFCAAAGLVASAAGTMTVHPRCSRFGDSITDPSD